MHVLNWKKKTTEVLKKIKTTSLTLRRKIRHEENY